MASEISFPDQRSNLGLLLWGRKVLATGPPGKSIPLSFDSSLYNLDTNPHCWLCSSQICSPERERISRSVVSDSLQLHELSPARLLCPWNSAGQNTGVGSHSFLQGIFPTHGLNPGLPHCRHILYCLSHQGSPRSRGRETQKGTSDYVMSQGLRLR